MITTSTDHHYFCKTMTLCKHRVGRSRNQRIKHSNSDQIVAVCSCIKFPLQYRMPRLPNICIFICNYLIILSRFMMFGLLLSGMRSHAIFFHFFYNQTQRAFDGANRIYLVKHFFVEIIIWPTWLFALLRITDMKSFAAAKSSRSIFSHYSGMIWKP